MYDFFPLSANFSWIKLNPQNFRYPKYINSEVNQHSQVQHSFGESNHIIKTTKHAKQIIFSCDYHLFMLTLHTIKKSA